MPPHSCFPHDLRRIQTIAGPVQSKHRTPRARGTSRYGRPGMLTSLASDLRYAARMLRKAPLFTVVAVLCIALGSGAVTTIFSAMNALVLRPLPGVADAGRLVRLDRTYPGAEGHVSLTYGFYAQLRDEA